MSTTASQFQSKTEEKSFDASHRQKIKFNIGKGTPAMMAIKDII